MLRKYAFSDGKLVETTTGEAILWLYVDPNSDERKSLVADFQIDEHTLNSSLDPDESSRLEFEPSHTAVIFKYPKNYSAADQFLFRIASIGLFLFADRLVIVIPEDIPVVGGRTFAGVCSPRGLMLKIIYRLIFRYLEHLKVINMISDEIEKKISISMENRHLLNLFSLEKSMVYYLNAIGTNGFSLEKLKNQSAKVGFVQAELEILDDITIENNQCYKQAEIYSNILAGLMDARVSIVSNNLNILMKNLNFLTILIMVPTFIVSAFSMNLGIPLETHRHAFWIVLGMAGLSALAVVVWWKRSKF